MSLERWDWAKLRKEVESGKEPRTEAVTTTTKKTQASHGRQERGDEQEINAMKAVLQQVEKNFSTRLVKPSNP